MNSNYDDYVATVADNTRLGLSEGALSISDALPCHIARELEVPANRFIQSADPLALSYRSLPRVLTSTHPPIPRKIDFGSAVYLKEGIIDSIYRDTPVTVVFVGDGNSDKRFAYNTHRLLAEQDGRYEVHCYVGNEGLIGQEFAGGVVPEGWSGGLESAPLFYNAPDWSQLDVLHEVVGQAVARNRRVLTIVDVDGTYLCPRPLFNPIVKEARRRAIVEFSNDWFDSSLFSSQTPSHVEKLLACYDAASATTFSKDYDDEDLTMLLTLGIYCGTVESTDTLVNRGDDVGFVEPIEFLTYSAFKIDNDHNWRDKLSRLRTLYTQCATILQNGGPTAFPQFRSAEERVLQLWSREGEEGEPEAVLSREMADFVLSIVELGALPIAMTDRPNVSLGLRSNSDRAHTASPGAGAFISRQLRLV